jgi:hypothetical protein
MKKYMLQAILATSVLFIGSGCCSTCEKPATKPMPAPTVKNPADQTDVYAIPLDTDEQDERMEEKTLNKQAQTNEAKMKQAAGATAPAMKK